MGRWTSHTIGFGLFFLIVFPPLAFGSVYPWATSILELVSFSLVLVWLIGVRFMQREKEGQHRGLSLSLGLPLGLFLGLVIMWKLVGHSIVRHHDDYEADRFTCVSCARCFQSCPQEHARLKTKIDRPAKNSQ